MKISWKNQIKKFSKITIGASLLTCTFLVFGNKTFAQNINDGTKAEELLKYDEAKSVYNKIIAKEPANAAVYYHLAVIAYHNYQYDSAKYLLDKGVQANNNEPLIYVGKGLISLYDKNETQAMQNFAKALELSNNKNAYVMQQITDAIWQEQDVNDGDYAYDMITKAAALDKKDIHIIVSTGDAYRLKGEGGKGLSEYKKAIDADPKFLLAQLRVGESYAKVKSYPAAEGVYNDILKIDPNYPPVYPDLGELFYQKGSIEKAKESYKKFLSLVGTSPAERLRYASFLYLIRDYKSALEELNKVAQSLPNNVLLLRIKSYCEFQTGDYASGMNTIQKLFSTVKKEALISMDYEYYGNLLRKTNQDSLGVINLKTAIIMDSTSINADIYDSIEKSYYKMKKYNDATNILEQKLAKTKDNISKIDYYTLGRDYFYAGNYQRADTNFAMVNKYFPTYAIAYWYRARCKLELNKDIKTGAAKPYYEKFIEVSASDAARYKPQIEEGYQYLVSYYYNKNELEKTKEYANKVKEMDPDNKANNDMLKFLNAPKKK